MNSKIEEIPSAEVEVKENLLSLVTESCSKINDNLKLILNKIIDINSQSVSQNSNLTPQPFNEECDNINSVLFGLSKQLHEEIDKTSFEKVPIKPSLLHRLLATNITEILEERLNYPDHIENNN